MSMTMEQAVTQLEQELFTLRGQVAAESGLADAVRAINNLATAQVRKDTPSLIDVKCLGLPKDFSGRGGFSTVVEEDEGIVLGVIKESEMMLEWAAEQATEITMWRRAKPGVCVLQQMHTELMLFTSDEANDTVASSRKHP